MKAQIRYIRDYGERPTRRARVFVSSNATDLADEWFTRNKVWSLDFKCKTWGKVCRLLHKINKVAISDLLECNKKDIVYSVNCGCSSCPCSPGYNVYNTNKNNKGVWVNIEASADELDPLMEYLKLADLELQVEIAENNNK